jgi:hypothetical protein
LDAVLKVAGGNRETIPTSIALKTTLSKISSMPQGFLQGMTGQKTADLLEYPDAQK